MLRVLALACSIRSQVWARENFLSTRLSIVLSFSDEAFRNPQL